MEKRSSLGSSQLSHQSLPRKYKRRSSRRSNTSNTWAGNNQQNGDLVSDIEYNQPRMLWQSNMPHNVHGNGQRLFTAMSDPSVCGYSTMPVTYTMQPVAVPPMYRLFQTVPLPDARTVHSKTRTDRKRHMANIPNANNNIANGSNSQQENGMESTVHIAYQNGDYTSLPPTADSGINGDELNSEHRRYSDPGLGPAKPLVCSDSEDSIDSGSSITTISRSNKLILSLIEQVTDLKKYNSQLFKELNVTKSYVENMTAKLMQCKHCTSSDYQPGMLSDLVREIREANKKCEEGLFTKMKTMLDEKFSQQRKEIEEYKSQLSKVMKDKEESDKRVTKLEEELAALKLTITNEGREITAFEEETLALRRELQEARASRTLAENHAAKCVNFALPDMSSYRHVKPVTFERPCVIRTPVRTTFTNTYSLFPVSDSMIAPPFAPSVPYFCPTEVAAHLVPETTRHGQNGTDPWPAFPEKDESVQCLKRTSMPHQCTMISRENDDIAYTVETSQNENVMQNTWPTNTTAISWETSTLAQEPDWFQLAHKISEATNHMTMHVPEEQKVVKQYLEQAAETKMKLITKPDEAKILMSPHTLKEHNNNAANTIGISQNISSASQETFQLEAQSKWFQLVNTSICDLAEQIAPGKMSTLPVQCAEAVIKSAIKANQTKDVVLSRFLKEEPNVIPDDDRRGDMTNKADSTKPSPEIWRKWFEESPKRRNDLNQWLGVKQDDLKRSLSESNLNCEEPQLDNYSIISNESDVSLHSSPKRYTVPIGPIGTKKGDGPDDYLTSSAITVVPDVAIINGGIPSTDLCSRRVLTSRVLTAPSRATYTTAYI